MYLADQINDDGRAHALGGTMVCRPPPRALAALDCFLPRQRGVTIEIDVAPRHFEP